MIELYLALVFLDAYFTYCRVKVVPEVDLNPVVKYGARKYGPIAGTVAGVILPGLAIGAMLCSHPTSLALITGMSLYRTFTQFMSRLLGIEQAVLAQFKKK